MSLESLTIYPLDGYSFIERESQPDEDNSVTARLKRLEDQNDESGTRRSVEAIMLVTSHGFPHVLVLQVANAFYKLPGGYLDPLETDSAGLIARLNEQLGVPFSPSGKRGDWKVGDLLTTWWRPNYDTFYYPYIPVHISQPKECKKLYLVELPKNKTFAVPVNMKLHAIPVYEFYDNAARYGPQFSGIPYVLSKYDIYNKESNGVEIDIKSEAKNDAKNGDQDQK
uniref:Cleavage and polyadenylation specificity factor subunit 5 n=1 Tax=Kwoniella pini CBS 10737 TaxID=1296096 RepID=A0A1B9I4L3_9TREE|nr:cleavage and polyadenylation specificity factor subunit 5 [Kwoniella pini CBS 10737]OCF50456.1 cleavage and polyadenylation specificity factor subunit 5 [Kwoniella pini CBS 10737]